MKRLRKRVIRLLMRLFPGEAGFAVPLVLRWVKSRADMLLRRKGIVRGTVVVWPYAGHAMVVADDVTRPARGQVLVQIATSAISPGTERAFFSRMPNAAAKFPMFPGYSAAGEIVAVGRGVREFKPGDKVALATEHGSVAVARTSEIAAIPPGVSLDEASFVQLGVIALQALQKARLQPGDRVAVFGHGVIGQLLVQLAAAYGAHPVISVSRTARRLTEPLLRAAQQIITLDRDGLQSLAGLDAAVTFEVTGSPEALTAAVQCTRQGGRIILTGSTRGITQHVDFGLLADKAITLVGAHITSVPKSAWQGHAQTFLALMEQQRVKMGSLISERVHPAEAEWFYRRLCRADDGIIGAVFSWDRLASEDRMRRVSFLTPPDTSALHGGRMVRWPISKSLTGEQEGSA